MALRNVGGGGWAAGEPVSPELALVDSDLRRRVLSSERYETVARGVPPPVYVLDDDPPRGRGRSWMLRIGTGLAIGMSAGVALVTVSAPSQGGTPSPVAVSLPRVAEAAPSPPRPAPAPAAAEVSRPPDAHRGRTVPVRVPAAAHRRPEVSEIEPATDLIGPLPSPTPPELRLQPTAARSLLEVARRHHVDWAALLAAVRTADGAGWTRARPSELARVARHLGRDRTPDEIALARYHQAIGVDALVSGLTAARSVLAARVLRDPRIQVYQAGRNDIATGRVDVRVLVLLLYLARTEGSVAVSSLVSGHAAPGTGSKPSAHAYGAAVDIRAVAGVPVLDHQEPGGKVEQAIRDMLLLPAEVRPLQVFSRLSLGDPTVALADHERFVGVGFDPTVSRSGPLELLWRIAGTAYDVPWSLLGAINEIETNNGRLLAVSPAGAVGWMQFMPSTWARYGVDADGNGTADPWNPTDAVFSAARYLTAAGVQSSPASAVWAYNHAGWYVDHVLARAAQIGAG